MLIQLRSSLLKISNYTMSDQVKIGIFGAGAIGSAVYDLLRDRTAYSVTVADIRPYSELHPKAVAEED